MDFLLKQRLVGAVVLVALGVIFIPMLLEGPDSDLVPEMAPMPEPVDLGADQSFDAFPSPVDLPEEPEQAVLQDDTAPLTGNESDDASGIELPLPPAEETVETGMTVKQTAPPAENAPPAPVVTSPVGNPVTPLGNWVVQMGSFSSEENALRLRDRLRKAGFATQVEKVKVDARTLYRVRVGPYLEREQADADQQKLAAKFELKGRVLSYP